jgi:excisionase family DNA binding protein
MERSNPLSAPSQRSIARRDDEHTMPEAAALLGVSVRYAWYLVSRGELPSFKRLGRRLIADADVQAYVERVHAEEERARAATSTRHEHGETPASAA